MPPSDVVVIGAGMAGLTAATHLRRHGQAVTVIEKADVVGGRLATADVGDARADLGAQFFTTRTAAFAAEVEKWIGEGLVHEWCRGFAIDDGYPRYTVRGGMARLAEHLATPLDVRLGTMAFTVRRRDGRWRVTLADGNVLDASALVLTCPVPQSASLLITADVDVPDALRRSEYDRTIAMVAALDGPSSVPAPGGVQEANDVLSFVVDNSAKGVSAAPSLTLHAGAAWSLAHWDDDRAELAARLLAAAEPWIGSRRVIEHQVRRWRFATPQAPWPEPALVVCAYPFAVLAGDAFAGPRVEGAFTSGRAAADAFLSS